jgi:hypothetical protein
VKNVRVRVWVGTLAVAMIYVGAIDFVDIVLFSPRFTVRALSLALAFAFVQVVAIVLFVGGLFVRKWIGARRERRSLQLQRQIQEALAGVAIGQDELPRLRSLMERSRRDVEKGIGAAVATLLGDARTRLLTVSSALGIEQPDDRQRLDALFGAAAAGNLRRRAVLVEQLEHHALILAYDQIPRALASDDPSFVTAALDMLRAWKRMLPVPDVEKVLRHPDAAVRIRALQALPYVVNATHSAVFDALHDAHAEVRAAAAVAAGKLRLAELSDALVRALSDPARDVACAAAFALAVLPDGVAKLQQAVSGGNRPAAGAAFEALEKVTLGRMELA